MDRETTFLLALGLLIAAGIVVSVSGWILFVRERRVYREEHAPGELERSAPVDASTQQPDAQP